jgi:hypothetical protein
VSTSIVCGGTKNVYVEEGCNYEITFAPRALKRVELTIIGNVCVQNSTSSKI